ncbi:MAG: hypothetical protein WD491_05765 [Balneolales bacterium]
MISSYGSGWLLHTYGYNIPRSLNSREDYILIAMKLVLFTLLVIMQVIILLLIGLNPFEI